ncbi:MAG: penicillin-binding protein 1C [Hyphomicrobiaceae bacterium]
MLHLLGNRTPTAPRPDEGRGASGNWPPKSWRRIAVGLAVLGLTATLAGGAGAYALYRKAEQQIGPLSLGDANQASVVVVDREDRLLRPFTTADGRWRLPVETKDVDPRYLKMLFAFEDRRFYEHGGVDARSVARAVAQMIRHGRLVSGASTLTMQVARLVDGKHERTGPGKLRQMARAWQLEKALSKDEILQLYLRLAPFGGNIEGVRAASLAYFGKEPRRLSIAQAALLVALPQSPESRRPDRHAKAARVARNRVLNVALANGVITAAEAARAREEAIPAIRREFPKIAAHLSESEVADVPGKSIHKLTLDRNLQVTLEKLAATHAALLGDNLSAAILVVDHSTGEVLAHVGSPGYLEADRKGAIDMTYAVRSPGSTLKPFIYGLGFESGFAHPETLIEDRPVRFGNYAPKNFDEDFHGTVTIREALSRSLNIPAVRMLARVGPGKLVGRFRRAGVDARFPDNSEPTLAMALGGTGLTLHDLAQLYCALPRRGESITLTHRWGERIRILAQTKVKPLVNAHRLMSPLAAWYVSDILKDAPPPPDAKGGRFAYKTGTSYGYRDAWAVGYDGAHVIAVWVGRPDGTSVPGLMGRTAAAPILFDAFARLSQKRVPLPSPPPGALQVAGADLPPPLKRWKEPGEEPASGPYLSQPLVISFPPDRSEIETMDVEDTGLVLKAEGGSLPLTWLIDGAPIKSDPHAREVMWQPGGPGFAKLTVMDSQGHVDRASIRVK